MSDVLFNQIVTVVGFIVAFTAIGLFFKKLWNPPWEKEAEKLAKNP